MVALLMTLSAPYRWYTHRDRRRFVYDTWDNGSRLGRVVVECTLSITHCLRLNLQLHTIDLVRACRISSFCTVAWQLARFQLTRRIARSVGDSWASCIIGYAVAFLTSHSRGCLDVLGERWRAKRLHEKCIISYVPFTHRFLHNVIMSSGTTNARAVP